MLPKVKTFSSGTSSTECIPVHSILPRLSRRFLEQLPEHHRFFRICWRFGGAPRLDKQQRTLFGRLTDQILFRCWGSVILATHPTSKLHLYVYTTHIFRFQNYVTPNNVVAVQIVTLFNLHL